MRKRIRKAFDFLVPVLLVAVIITMLAVRDDTNSRIQRQGARNAYTAALIACDTVHDAGLAQHAFLVKSFGASTDPRTKTFLHDLAISVDETYDACLVKADKLK